MDDPAPTPQGPTHPPPSTPPPKPAKTPGATVPVVPTLVNGAAGLAATVGTLGAATGGAGVMAAAAAVGLGGGALVARNRPAAARMLKRTVTQTRTQRQAAKAGRAASRKAAATRKAGVRAASPGPARRKAKGAARVAATRARSQGVMDRKKATGAKRTAAREAAGVRRAAAANRVAQARVAKASRRSTAAKPRTARGTGTRAAGSKADAGRRSPFGKLGTAGRRTSSGRGHSAGKRSPRGLASRGRGPVARAHRRNARAAAARTRLGKLATTGRSRLAARRKRLGDAATSKANDRDARRSHLRAKKTANRAYRRKVWAARLTSFGRRRLERLAALRNQYMAALDDIDATYGQGVALVTPLSEENRATPLGFIQTVPYINGGTMTDQFNFLGITEDMMHAAQAGDMDGALNLLHLAEQMPTVFTNIANAFVTVASRTNDEMPIGPETRAAFEEVASAVQKIVDAAEQVAPTMRREHEADIERLENPRTNEQAWDVTANG